MEHFRSYLLSKRIVSEKRLGYYLSWITQFYAFYDKSLGTAKLHVLISENHSLNTSLHSERVALRVIEGGIQFY